MSTFVPRVDKTKLYTTLCVPFDADIALIRSSYKRLALKFHPDRHTISSDEEKRNASIKFQEIGFAFEILQDTELREVYDKLGMPGVEMFQHNPTTASSNDNVRAEEAEFLEKTETEKMNRAYATYRSVFDSTSQENVKNLPVHNMATQRGSGSFEAFQRQRLNDIFEE